jgi:N-acetylglucosaminyldiphosphoundecaprenol N-acetyl-beta-D-mannosaminyltransferase
LCVEQRFSVFFLGGTKVNVDNAIKKLRERFPTLLIVGSHHGYFQKVGPESDAVVEMINTVKPNLLFVGFGMPAQEYWISRNLERLDANAVLPAGSMID